MPDFIDREVLSTGWGRSGVNGDWFLSQFNIMTSALDDTVLADISLVHSQEQVSAGEQVDQSLQISRQVSQED
jgi:hypothetical protein